MTDGSVVDSCRRHFSWIGRLVCGLAAVMAVMAVLPAAASAALTISSPSLARNSGPPGSVLVGGINSSGIVNTTVSVTRSGTPTTTLGSIGYSYSPTPAKGASGCVTAANTNGTKSVNPALPRAPGTYTISFTAYSTGTCGGTSSSTISGGTVTVTTPTANPHLALPCGLKVALVLDESASIYSPTNHTSTVRAAALAFVDALSDTESSVAIIPFSTSARSGIPYTEVTQPTIDSTFGPFINATGAYASTGYNPNRGNTSGTNWESAFRAVSALSGGLPELVVFVTDGDPNGTVATTSFSTSLNGGADVMTAAVNAANAVKVPTTGTTGSHVFAVGVGPAVSSEASVSRLTAVSGDVEFTGAQNFADTDYTVATDFEDLKNSLTRIVAGICGGTLTVAKSDFDENGQFVEASGWSFSATLHSSTAHRWLTPSDAGTGPTATQVTNREGVAEFHWKLTPGPGETPGNATVSVVREHSKPGYHLVFAECEVVDADGAVSHTLQRTTTPIGTDLIIPPKGHATCEVRNARTVAHLTVIKRLRPVGDPGTFDLLVNGTPVRENVGSPGGWTGRLPFPTGTYMVSERAVAPTDLADYDTSTTCVNYDGTEPRPTIHGVGTEADPVSVPLRHATDDWVCTITNVSTRFGNLTVIKHLVPSDAPGAFDLIVNGTVVKAGARDGDSAELTHIPFDDYAVGEDVSADQTVTLADYETSVICVDESTDPATVVASNPTGPDVSVTLSREHENIVCTITNEHIPVSVAHLEVVKNLVPSSDAGLFDLRIDGTTLASAVGDGGSTGSLPLEFGTYKVSESGAAGTATDLASYDTSTTCVNMTTGHKVHGVGTASDPVSVTLNHETDNWVCTITNMRKAPPTEPGGDGDKPHICTDVENGVAECGDVAAAPDLFVIKQMPTHARVGDRIPITITVLNVGQSTAHQVRVHETPPPGGRIVSAGNHGSIQSNGTVIWNLGSLAPGAKRTVHATLLVTGTGLHMDTAVASASNADPAFDRAAVRARAAMHPPPPAVTG